MLQRNTLLIGVKFEENVECVVSASIFPWFFFWSFYQRYTYRVLQTIQMKLILLCIWAEPAILGSTKTALKFKYEI